MSTAVASVPASEEGERLGEGELLAKLVAESDDEDEGGGEG